MAVLVSTALVGSAATALAASGLHVGVQTGATITEPPCSAAQRPPCVFEGFEIDGNTSVDTGAVDWQTPPPNTMHFTDGTGSTDDIFSGGSKELQQNSWVCTTGSAPAKSDIYPGGDITVRNVTVGTATDQVVDMDFTRVGTGGDAHIDYEFNKASQVLNTAGCPSSVGIPLRSIGDILLTFDSNTGGSTVTVSAFRWNGSTYVALNTGSQGTTFEGVENGITTNGVTALSDPGVQAGQFGEAGLDLTKTIGNITCGEFGRVYMKTRSSTSLTSEVKDRAQVLPFNLPNCPKSSLVKGVRDDTATPGGAFTSTVTAKPGDQLTYQLAYANNGQAPATNVAISDPLPAHETFVSCNNSCTSSGGVITWPTVGSVAAGGTITDTFTVKLDPSFPAGTTPISNVAVVNTKEEGNTNSNTVTVSVNAAPILNITKTADSSSVSNGDTIGYTINVSNTGNAPATNVKVTDTLPTNSGLSWTISAPIPSGCGIASGVLTCTVGTMAAGTGTFSVHISSRTTSATCGSVSNKATVTADTGITNTTQSSVIQVNCAVLTLTKTADSGTVAAGQQVGYMITVTNSGAGTAKNVTVTDTLPNNLTGLSWSLSPANTPTGCSISTANPQVLSCTFATVSGGTAIPIHVVSSTGFTTCGTLTNHASASSDNAGSPITPGIPVVVTCPSLTFTKAPDSATLNAGDQLGYVIKVVNSGNGDATAVHITDTLATGHDLSWSLDPANTPTGCSISNTTPQVLTCDFTTVAAGATVSIHVVSATTQADCTTFSNQAVLSATNVSANLTATAPTVTVNCPNLALTKTADQGTVAMGTAIGYTIKLTNSGTGTAYNVVVTDNLPTNAGLSWSISTPVTGCSINGTPAVLTCNFATFAPGSVSVHVTSATTATCGSIQNVASVSASNATSVSTQVITITVTCAVPTLTKAACPAPTVVPGGFLTYTLTFGNSGSGTATTATLTDTLPAGETVVDSGGGTVTGSTVTWQVGPIAPGGGGKETLVVQVTAATGSTLVNNASLSSPQAQAPATSSVSTLVSNAGAITHGSSYAVDVKIPALIPEIGPLAPAGPSEADSTKPGPNLIDPGSSLPISVPGLLTVDVAHETALSQVTSSDADSTATAKLAGVNLLAGALTADVVTGVSQSVASATTATYDSTGNSYVNLVVNGVGQTVSKPNTHITVYVPGTTVKLADVVVDEETGTAGLNTATNLWSSSHSINMLDVTLLQPFATFPALTQIIVSHAQTDATYPSGMACNSTPNTVSGDAFSASAYGTLNGMTLLSAQVGNAVLPPTGGTAGDSPATVTIPNGVDAGAATNSTSGSTSPSPNATAASTIAAVNLLNGLVTVSAIDVTSTSSATGKGANVAFGSTCSKGTCPNAPAASDCSSSSPCFVNLMVNGQVIVGVNGGTIAPNTRIGIPDPVTGGILLVILNEQITQNDGTANASGTINAIHIYALNSIGVVTGEIVVGHAHSDAHKLS